MPEQVYDVEKIVLPPATYSHEKQKFETRLPVPKGLFFDEKFNELFTGKGCRFLESSPKVGTHTVVSTAKTVSMADVYGNFDVPILCLNLVYPSSSRNYGFFK